MARIVSYNTVRQNMGASYTMKDWDSLLGDKPHALNITARLFNNNTTSMMLDTLMNIHKLKPGDGQATSISSMSYTWGIDATKVKTIRIVKNVEQAYSGNNGTEVLINLEERYFNPNDIFMIQGSRDSLWVIRPPRRVNNKNWEYACRFITNDIQKGLNLAFAVKDNFVQLRSNAHPEGSEKGYHKTDSNVELHRNWMTFHRVDAIASGHYRLKETSYVELAKKQGGYEYYKIEPYMDACMRQFLEAKNQALLFGEANFDRNGKCLIQDDQGRDIPIGDGIITQVEKRAHRIPFSRFTSSHLRNAIQVMSEKAQNPIGNQFLFIVNTRLWNMINDAMYSELAALALPATAFYSKATGSMQTVALNPGTKGRMEDYNFMNVGASFMSYTWQGNTISFAVERAMDYEYSDRAYGVLIDVTPDGGRRPAIEQFTFEGADKFTGTLKGLGGTTGKASGDVASPVHGVQHIMAGFSGVAVYAPHRSCIMEEAIASFV